MLIFDFEAVCRPAGFYRHAGERPAALGAPGLPAAALLRGEYAVSAVGASQAGAPAFTAGPGALALAAGPISLVPRGGASALVLSLAGSAPAALALPPGGALLLPSGACPGGEELFLRLFAAETKTAAHRLCAQCYELLCLLSAAAKAPPRPPAQVQAALALIHEHYGEVYGVEEVAAQLEISKCHLIRLFTRALGVSPGRYLTRVRLENAKRLLCGGALPLEAVAGLCGFSGPGYFCKVFRAHTGESPAAWARRNTKNAPPSASGLEAQMYL